MTGLPAPNDWATTTRQPGRWCERALDPKAPACDVEGSRFALLNLDDAVVESDDPPGGVTA
jgi:hypothetical protein